MVPRVDRAPVPWFVLWALAVPAAVADEATATVVLRWQAVSGAAAYELEVARDQAFTDRVVNERVEVTGYRWRAIPDSRHYWRVRSVDSIGRRGPWSKVKVIGAVLQAPDPVEPPDGARFTWDRDGRTVAFAAAPSAVLREYRLEVAADEAFSKPLLSRHGRSPSFRAELPGLGAFHWRFGGVALDGQEAPWSPPRTFTVDLGAPRLLSPEPGAALPFGKVAVAWEPLKPAARWLVTVEREGAGSRRLEAAASPFELVPERPGRHLVRVAAVLADGRAGPASDALEFQVAPPAPLAAPRLGEPASGAEIDDAARPVAFAWEPVPGAAAHDLQVGPPDGLESGPVRPVAGARIEVAGLRPGPLAWRVRARDAFGGPGAWSEVRPLQLGPRPPARVEVRADDDALVADGLASTRLSIRVLDASGRAVPGAPSVEASAGRVEGLAPAGEGWEARYVAPPGPPPQGVAEISVRERDLEAFTRIGLSPKVERLDLGVLAGWRANFEAVSSPSLGVEVRWRTPLLGDRLLVSARASWYQESASLPPSAALSSPATARVFPLAALLLHEWPLAWGSLHAGAGLGVDLAWLTVGRVSELAASPAGILALGAGRPLGPGVAFLELSASVGSVNTPVAELRTGGLSLSAGYRLRP